MPTHRHRLAKRRNALGIVAAALVGGCSMIPPYERPPAPVPAQFPGVAAEPPAATPAADLEWRSFIAEPRLQRLVEIALTNNRDLRVAALRVEQSHAQYQRTRSSLFPQLDLRTAYNVQRTSGVPGTLKSATLSAGVSAYELDFFGRVRSSNEQALQQYFETEEAQRSAHVGLVAEVATQYFALREAEEQLKLARQTLGLVNDSYRLNKAQFDVGEIDELDLSTAEGQVKSAEVNVLTYQRQATQAEDQLVLLLGTPLPADLPPAAPFGDGNALADIPAGLPADLIERRPDILAAEHTLLAANANIGVARAAFFPSISLTGSVGRTSDALGSLLGSGVGITSFAPQLSLPLFNAGSNRANLTAAQAGKEIEVANYEHAIQTAFREVADARYRQGDDRYLTVLLAQQDLYSAQQARLRAVANRASSQIALYRALGGGWQ